MGGLRDNNQVLKIERSSKSRQSVKHGRIRGFLEVRNVRDDDGAVGKHCLEWQQAAKQN